MVGLHGPVPGAPRGDPAAARRVARGARRRRGRAAERSRAWCRGGRSREAFYRQGEVHRLRGRSSRRPRRRIARRAGTAGSRSPAWRCLRLAAGGRAARRRPRFAGRWARRASRCRRAAAAGRLGRDPARGRRRRGRARRLPRELDEGRRATTRAACWARWPRTPAGAVEPRRRRRAERARSRCVAPGSVWQRARGAVTRPLARASWSASACHALGDEDSAALELEAARDVVRASSERRPDHRPARQARASPAPTTARPDGTRARSPTPGRGRRAPTRRSPPSSSSASRTVGPPREQHRSAKLGVSSRAAATAYAYEHRLL